MYTLNIRKKHTFCVNWGKSFVNRLVHVCQQYVINEFDRLFVPKEEEEKKKQFDLNTGQFITCFGSSKLRT